MASYTNSANEPADRDHRRIFDRELYPLRHQLMTFAMRLMNDKSRAEDLFQETYAKSWKAIASYQPGTNPKAWLFRICKNAFINHYRAQLRSKPTVDVELVRLSHNHDESSQVRFSDLNLEFGRAGMGDEIMEALNSLKPQFRVVVLLDMEDFTYKEIAAILGLKLNTVRTRLHRARLLLAVKLQEYARQNGYNVTDVNPNAEDGAVGDDFDNLAMSA